MHEVGYDKVRHQLERVPATDTEEISSPTSVIKSTSSFKVGWRAVT